MEKYLINDFLKNTFIKSTFTKNALIRTYQMYFYSQMIAFIIIKSKQDLLNGRSFIKLIFL